MARKICENGEFYPSRCRKQARFAIGYRVLFGHRVNMNGPDEPMYQVRITFRCPEHKEIDNKVGELPIEEYNAKLEAAQ